jgi:hypothetical protein
MPPKQPPRPGLEYFTEAGEEWQAEKLNDLTQTFGVDTIIGDPFIHSSGQTRYRPISLDEALSRSRPNQFIVESEYNIEDEFERAFRINDYRTRFHLDYATLRPDIIEVLPARTFSSSVTPAGDLSRLSESDERLQLRVVEIKLTSEPSAGYFSEVAYYTMALAGWLVDHDFNERFLVVPDGVIWPGSHEASNLTLVHNELTREGHTPTFLQLFNAMEKDLETVPFEVFVFRIKRFLLDEIPQILNTESWRELDWHVDNRCKGCDYLGYPWRNTQGELTNHCDHCWPMAEREDHLSRVAFMSRGARSALENQGVNNVASLAQVPSNSDLFNSHQILRATRTVVSGRATSLQTQNSRIPDEAGTSATMPRWADLRIYLSVDFDVSSAITLAFGLKVFGRDTRRTLPSRRRIFIVYEKSLQAEQRVLLGFLDLVNTLLVEARSQDATTSVQFYLWDQLQYDHLTRVIGRHLQAILNNHNIGHLAWLFPPEELLSNPRMIMRRSTITIVRDVIRSILAAPMPHYYSLLGLARIYHNPSLPENIAQFRIHPLFEDPLSDQIPSERAHEIWSHSTSINHPWEQQMRTLEETISKRLIALETITQRLGMDLGEALNQRAPPINIGPPARENLLSVDGQLWYGFAKLNEALSELEIHKKRAMPPHEREARFHSARLTRRLMEQEESDAMIRLCPGVIANYRVYEMRPESSEVKLREGDFNCALSPEDQPTFLDKSLMSVTQGTRLQPDDGRGYIRMENVTSVTVMAIDRENRLIVLKPNQRWPTMLEDLEELGLANFAENVILDPTYHDFFTKKLLATLKAIGNPPSARDNSLVQRAMGLSGRGARRTPHNPPEDLLWNAPRMHELLIEHDLETTKNILEQHNINLDPSQWTAWRSALSSRLQLVWGPPGTGKSRTARAIVVGATVEAHNRGEPIRILICANNYNAMDNVLKNVYEYIQELLPDSEYAIFRLRSYSRTPPTDASLRNIDLEIDGYNPSHEVIDLKLRLVSSSGITIVGTTPSQVYNLLTLNNGNAQAELFDLILIDEASQMDVPFAILAISSLATNGSLILAGDPKQLPPIHKAEAPLNLENVVGSIYNFYNLNSNIDSTRLNVNYRSNKILVDFSLNAGYESELHSYSPQLRLNFITPLPVDRPQGWPQDLYWTNEWVDILDPEKPAVCFVYSEGSSSQWNQFEADAVSSLVLLLYNRLGNKLENEREPSTGDIIQLANSAAYSELDFWEKGIGIVTPHRAQQGKIVSRLQHIFGNMGIITPEMTSAIRNAVDTVERFQGQQRDIIVASFAMSDRDAIRDEDEFLMSLNRFNVMASRARAKLIVLISQQVVDHLSDDPDTLRDSRLLKGYVESFCQSSRSMNLGYYQNGNAIDVEGVFKHR